MGLCMYNLGNVPKAPLTREVAERIERAKTMAGKTPRKKTLATRQYDSRTRAETKI